MTTARTYGGALALLCALALAGQGARPAHASGRAAIRPAVTEPCPSSGSHFDGWAASGTNLAGNRADIENTGIISLCNTADAVGISVWTMLAQGFCCTAPFGYVQVGYEEHADGFDGPVLFSELSSQTTFGSFLDTFYLSYTLPQGVTHNYNIQVIKSAGHFYGQPSFDGSVIDALTLDWTVWPALVMTSEETHSYNDAWQTAVVSNLGVCLNGGGGACNGTWYTQPAPSANLGSPTNDHACYLKLTGSTSKFEVYDKNLLGYCM